MYFTSFFLALASIVAWREFVGGGGGGCRWVRIILFGPELFLLSIFCFVFCIGVAFTTFSLTPWS
jgi:hypothetical protein